MDSVILILVELGALFNYLIGEEDFPQRGHFGYARIHIWPFPGPYFLPSSGVQDGRSCVWPKVPEGALGAAAPRSCGPLPTSGLHFSNATVWICLPLEPLQQTLQHPARVGEVQLQGQLPWRAGLGGGDAVQGLSTT